jgi:hypothetical protein
MMADLPELTTDAERIAGGLRPRLDVIDERLTELAEHRRILTQALQGIAEQASRLLRQAGRASLLPSTLREWSGRPYLRISFEIPATDEQQRARLEPLIDRLIDRAELPGGLDLVKLAVVELAGARGFDVKILKPDAHLRADPIPITAMTTFSRGQQLTAAILLYCTLAALRARNRGRQRRRLRDAGILVLDNPIGTCSSVPLLELQRTIASEMGVQLIYATGVEDLEALETLPNTIRLRNRLRDRATGDLHVSHDNRVEAVRVVALGR